MYNIYTLSRGSLQIHYKIVSCVYQIFIYTCSQILLLWSKPFFSWQSQILLFSFHKSLFDSHCNAMSFLLLVIGNKTFNSPSLKHRTHFLWLQLLFVLDEIMAVNSMSFNYWGKKKTEFSIHICRSLPLMHLATSMLTWHNWSKSISQWILTVLMAKKNRKKSLTYSCSG